MCQEKNFVALILPMPYMHALLVGGAIVTIQELELASD